MRNKIDDFTAWFSREALRLRSLSSERVADEIAGRLEAVDGRLGIEVERENQSAAREIIFTAYSDPSAFSLVREIVDSLQKISGWKIIGLKPPRGFEFSLSVGSKKIAAKHLTFRPLNDVPLGFELFLPGGTPSGANLEEMAWLVVETGVGEELAGYVAHLEFAEKISLEDCYPIDVLAQHIIAIVKKKRKEK